MESDLPLFPEQASTMAPRVDAVYFALLILSAFFTLLIAALIVYFAIKYRRGSRADRTQPRTSYLLEVIWIGVPFVISVGIFAWGADVFFNLNRPPAGALEFTAIGKQWMWKFQHPQGRREINDLHVPVDRPVKLTMISQDVIHSLFVPAFRVKQDVLPGRYTTLWFEATRPGTYHLFCTEYCGTNHSRMKGTVHVMTPADYQAWLEGDTRGEPPAVSGEKLFEQLRCGSCHTAQAAGRGPSLVGLFGKRVPLVSGGSALVDEAYVRESILKPNAKVVAGYQPIMPTFEGQVSEEGILHLIAYIKSLAEEAQAP